MLIYSRIKLTESGGWEEENGMKKARENLHHEQVYNKQAVVQ